MRKEEKHEIEYVFNSPSSLRVIKVLMENRNVYVSKYFISKHSGVKNPLYILERLARMGWVEVIKLESFKRYKINLKNSTVRQLYDFFKNIGYIL